MVFGDFQFLLGIVIGGAVVTIISFLRGYFQHLGTRAAIATISWGLSSPREGISDKELQDRTLQLHSEITEFQTRKQRTRSREFYEQANQSLDEEEIRRQLRHGSIRREEEKGEFLKKFAPRLEMVFQEYEKRNIQIESDIESESEENIDILRWWVEQGETDRLLPHLRSLAQKLDPSE